MEKVKELIKWESEANSEKVVQVVQDPPLPKKIIPFLRVPLKGIAKSMAISRDSIFIGLETGEIQIISLINEEKQLYWQAHDDGIERIQVSKDNEVVVTAVAPELKIWMLGEEENYEERASIDLPEKFSFALNEQGKFLAIASSFEQKHKLYL